MAGESVDWKQRLEDVERELKLMKTTVSFSNLR